MADNTPVASVPLGGQPQINNVVNVDHAAFLSAGDKANGALKVVLDAAKQQLVVLNGVEGAKSGRAKALLGFIAGQMAVEIGTN